MGNAVISFKIKAKDSKARAGLLELKHGVIETPCFIPVATKGAIKALTFEEIEELGIQVLMCNTYHLYLRPGADVVEQLGGLHKFMNWNKPIITDSGGFQAFSLGYGMEHFANKQKVKFGDEERLARAKKVNKLAHVNDEHVTFCSIYDQSVHELTPEKSIELQHKLGGDIIIALDECTSPLHDYDYVKKSLQRTHKWAKRCLDFHKNLMAKDNSREAFKQAIFGVVQGGNFDDLRVESAKFIASLDFDGYAIGGFFGENKKRMYELVEKVCDLLPEEKVRHLLGIGTVEDLFLGVEKGIDLFDCNSATRIARSGYVFVGPESGGNIKNKFRYNLNRKKFEADEQPLDAECDCKVCRRHTRAYVRHLFRAKEYLAYTLVSYHNLYFMVKLMKDIKESIEKGNFLKLKKKWLKCG